MVSEKKSNTRNHNVLQLFKHVCEGSALGAHMYSINFWWNTQTITNAIDTLQGWKCNTKNDNFNVDHALCVSLHAQLLPLNQIFSLHPIQQIMLLQSIPFPNRWIVSSNDQYAEEWELKKVYGIGDDVPRINWPHGTNVTYVFYVFCFLVRMNLACVQFQLRADATPCSSPLWHIFHNFQLPF